MSTSELERLTQDQRSAVEVVSRRAAAVRPAARETVRAILRRHGIAESEYDSADEALRSQARVALHFHPERLSRTGKSVADGLLESGVYKNQFETGLSSGSPTAFAGGERDLWEQRLFAGAYHTADSPLSRRPKYGALELMDHADGPSPRFGSCYFVLRSHVALRSTFTFGGSQEIDAIERTTTLDMLEPSLAPLLARLERGQGALGVDHLTIPDLLAVLRGKRSDVNAPQRKHLGRALDSFVEAQVHGEIRLNEDVELLVCDPAFLGHPIGEVLAEVCAQNCIALSWHPGFTLPVHHVPEIFRDFPVRPLAERIVAGSADRILDAAKLGAAANSLALHPEAWAEWASLDHVLTQFRRLWHVMVLGENAHAYPAP